MPFSPRQRQWQWQSIATAAPSTAACSVGGRPPTHRPPMHRMRCCAVAARCERSLEHLFGLCEVPLLMREYVGKYMCIILPPLAVLARRCCPVGSPERRPERKIHLERCRRRGKRVLAEPTLATGLSSPAFFVMLLPLPLPLLFSSGVLDKLGQPSFPTSLLHDVRGKRMTFSCLLVACFADGR